jgi:hypothetical protein
MANTDTTSAGKTEKSGASAPLPASPKPGDRPIEIGGPKGPEPTRYGDWEQKGRCTDF